MKADFKCVECGTVQESHPIDPPECCGSRCIRLWGLPYVSVKGRDWRKYAPPSSMEESVKRGMQSVEREVELKRKKRNG